MCVLFTFCVTGRGSHIISLSICCRSTVCAPVSGKSKQEVRLRRGVVCVGKIADHLSAIQGPGGGVLVGVMRTVLKDQKCCWETSMVCVCVCVWVSCTVQKQRDLLLNILCYLIPSTSSKTPPVTHLVTGWSTDTAESRCSCFHFSANSSASF